MTQPLPGAHIKRNNVESCVSNKNNMNTHISYIKNPAITSSLLSIPLRSLAAQTKWSIRKDGKLTLMVVHVNIQY